MHVLELLKLSSESGTIALLIGVIVALGLYYFVKLVKLIVSKVESSSDVIINLGKSLTNDKGEPVKHVDNFLSIIKKLDEIKEFELSRNEKINKYADRIDLLVDNIKDKQCKIDECPYFGKVLSELKLLIEKFDQFERRANDSRNITGNSLDEMRTQMQILASEISQQSKQMVNVLTDLLVGRKTNLK